MKRQGNLAPQSVNNHTMKDPMDSEGDEISISELRRNDND
jgi:hypothetical protein